MDVSGSGTTTSQNDYSTDGIAEQRKIELVAESSQAIVDARTDVPNSVHATKKSKVRWYGIETATARMS